MFYSRMPITVLMLQDRFRNATYCVFTILFTFDKPHEILQINFKGRFSDSPNLHSSQQRLI